MISLSLFAEVEQTALHAVTIFGALITTAFASLLFFCHFGISILFG
jgi:hypothetical protein